MKRESLINSRRKAEGQKRLETPEQRNRAAGNRCYPPCSVIGRYCRASLLCCLWVVLALITASTAAFAEKFTVSSFQEARQLGLARNLRLHESEQRVQEARHALLRVRAVFLPKVSLSAGFSDKGAAFTIPSFVFQNAPKDPGFFTGYKNEWITRLQVDQPLFTGGRNLRSYHVAKRDLEIQEETHRLRRLNLEVEITRAYYGVLLSQRILAIKQELIEQSKRHQAEVARRLQAGDVSRFDKLRADVQLANLYPDLIRARNALEVSVTQFKNLLGLKPDDELQVGGAIEYQPESVDVATAQKAAALKRPEIQISRISADIAGKAREINRSRFFPTLGAFYTQDFRSNSLDTLMDSRHRNWTLGLALTFPIFEGGAAYYQAREEASRVEQAQLRQEQTQRDVQVEVVQAALELKRAAEVIESQKQTVAHAEEALKIANVSYANGVITNLELMDTQLALDQARINFVTAVYDYLVGQAQFCKAVGSNP